MKINVDPSKQCSSHAGSKDGGGVVEEELNRLQGKGDEVLLKLQMSDPPARLHAAVEILQVFNLVWTSQRHLPVLVAVLLRAL